MKRGEDINGSKRELRMAVRVKCPANSSSGTGTGSGSVSGSGAGYVATNLVEALPAFRAARTVALYHALPDEVPTEEMLCRWSGKKRLALPVVSGDTMIFREYTSGCDMSRGAFGIREPLAGREIPPEEIDLALVPGVAFDSRGGRLGRGGGFYDRYLSRPEAARIYKVGLCPSHALAAEVPTEAHDVKMDKIILGN